MTHQNTLLTQTQMCPKGFDDEHLMMNFINVLGIVITGCIKISALKQAPEVSSDHYHPLSQSE